MLKYTLKSQINSFLHNKRGNSVLNIKTLGTGGAFDVEEKNSSILITLNNEKNILVDCGATVYGELKKNKLVDKVDCVAITHCHDDHVGSLSSLIYDRWFLHQKVTNIVCHHNIKTLLTDYLINFSGNKAEQFIIIDSLEDQTSLIQELGIKINTIETTGFHVENMPSAGFVFEYNTGKENLYLVYSGDINVSMIDLLKTEIYHDIFQKLLKNQEAVFVFHDATTHDYPGNVHCYHKLLEPLAEQFQHVFVYHHNKEQAKKILQECPRVQSLTLLENDLVLEERLGAI